MLGSPAKTKAGDDGVGDGNGQLVTNACDVLSTYLNPSLKQGIRYADAWISRKNESGG